MESGAAAAAPDAAAGATGPAKRALVVMVEGQAEARGARKRRRAEGGDQVTPQGRSWSEKAEEFKQGRFTARESKVLADAIEHYAAAHGLDLETLAETSYKADAKGAWTEIAEALPDRSMRAVYRHGVKILQRKTRKTGRWTEDEVAMLHSLVAEHGKRWTVIAKHLNRPRETIRDKWKDLRRQDHVAGMWSAEEVNALKQLVAPFEGAGKIPWTQVAEQFPTRRHPESLRLKWQTDVMFRKDGPAPLWPATEELRLATFLYERGWEDEEEVDWVSVGREMTKPAFECKNHWRVLRKRIGEDSAAGCSFEDALARVKTQLENSIASGVPEALKARLGGSRQGSGKAKAARAAAGGAAAAAGGAGVGAMPAALVTVEFPGSTAAAAAPPSVTTAAGPATVCIVGATGSVAPVPVGKLNSGARAVQLGPVHVVAPTQGVVPPSVTIVPSSHQPQQRRQPPPPQLPSGAMRVVSVAQAPRAST